MTIHIGITGSRAGCTAQQWVALFEEMERGQDRGTFFHHGDCVGVDKQAHSAAQYFRYITVSHPPTLSKFRANTINDITFPPLPYLERNQAIVDAVSLLIVVPSGPEADNPRSGTWATYRMAVKAGVETVVIEP